MWIYRSDEQCSCQLGGARTLPERLRYLNNARRPEWQRFAGVQLPGKIPTRSAQNIVLTERNFVNARFATDVLISAAASVSFFDFPPLESQIFPPCASAFSNPLDKFY